MEVNMDYKKLMLERIEKRKAQWLVDFERVKRYILKDKIGGEANRIWVEEQIKGLAFGVDVCCGDLTMGENSVGVDKGWRMIGASCYTSGDALIDWEDNSLDYVVTNYLEAFEYPFKALREWHRCLKPGGVLAFSCANADNYEDGIGPFCNPHRVTIFTKRTIKNYLTKACFVNIHVEDGEEISMRVKCNKLDITSTSPV